VTPEDDPKLVSLKERSGRAPLARPGTLHSLSMLTVVAGAGLAIYGCFRPWAVLYGAAGPAAISTDDANGAVATVVVGGALIELLAVGVALYGALYQRRARLLHLVSVLVAILGLLLLTRRADTLNHEVFLANLETPAQPSHLAEGVWLTAAGLGLGILAAVIALPLIARDLRV
jgi:sulfite exporter TauE/SafE